MTGRNKNLYSTWIKLLKILTWKIIVIYVSVSLIAYHLIKDLIDPLSLPKWTLSFIVVFFIACFPPIVLFSVSIDTVRHSKKNKDLLSDAKNEKLANETIERRFQIIDVFLLIAVIAFLIFFAIYMVA